MYNFEMPVMELVSFSAEDIIRTSDAGSSNFKYGNEATTSHVQRDLMSDAVISSKWSDFISSGTPDMGA